MKLLAFLRLLVALRLTHDTGALVLELIPSLTLFSITEPREQSAVEVVDAFLRGTRSRSEKRPIKESEPSWDR